jgi:dethiobiotin synthetase
MRVMIVGTGTEIGKTHVTECLLAQARSRGVRARAYKPIATGVASRCEDAERHAEAGQAPYEHPTFAYRRPVSPHLASREEARPIDLDRIRKRADEIASDVEVLFVEGAGGLFTPLSDSITNVDLLRSLMPAVVLLVAPDRLGVLHDVYATQRAARARDVRVDAVVLSHPPIPDESSTSNAQELERLGLGPVAAVFPRASADAAVSQTTAAQLWRTLALPH